MIVWDNYGDLINMTNGAFEMPKDQKLIENIGAVLYGKSRQGNVLNEAVCVYIYNTVKGDFSSLQNTAASIKSELERMITLPPAKRNIGLAYLATGIAGAAALRHTDGKNLTVTVKDNEGTPKKTFAYSPAEKPAEDHVVMDLYKIFYGEQKHSIRTNAALCDFLRYIQPNLDNAASVEDVAKTIQNANVRDHVFVLLSTGHYSYQCWLRKNNGIGEVTFNQMQTASHYMFTFEDAQDKPQSLVIGNSDYAGLPYAQQAKRLCTDILNKYVKDSSAFDDDYALALCYAESYFTDIKAPLEADPKSYKARADQLAIEYNSYLPAIILNEFPNNKYASALLGVQVDLTNTI